MERQRIKIREHNEIPYTYIGGTAVPKPHFRLVLTAEGVKKIAEILKKNDILEIDITDQSHSFHILREDSKGK